MRIKDGVAPLERGDFVEVDDAELDDYLQRLTIAPEPTAR
jgi:hypothetical protein